MSVVVMTSMSMIVMLMFVTMWIMPMIIMMLSAILGIFLFAELIRFIPSCFDEDFERWVEMNDKDEENETDNTKYYEENHFHRHNGEKGDHTRYYKWKNEEYKGHQNRTKIEEYHRKIQLSGNRYMSYSESGGCGEWHNCMLSLKDDEEFWVCKTHIHEERKY